MPNKTISLTEEESELLVKILTSGTVFHMMSFEPEQSQKTKLLDEIRAKLK